MNEGGTVNCSDWNLENHAFAMTIQSEKSHPLSSQAVVPPVHLKVLQQNSEKTIKRFFQSLLSEYVFEVQDGY